MNKEIVESSTSKRNRRRAIPIIQVEQQQEKYIKHVEFANCLVSNLFSHYHLYYPHRNPI